jgi:hypothetical protein
MHKRSTRRCLSSACCLLLAVAERVEGFAESLDDEVAIVFSRLGH